MPQYVSPKKSLGQHFLADPNIARKICSSLTGHGNYKHILEVGPGTGMLSKHLICNKHHDWYGMDVDRDAIGYLKKQFPEHSERIIEGDFLRYDLKALFGDAPFAVIGNFPYNISSQIVFKVLYHRSRIPEMVGMFQKEVAMRIASPPGSKTYGILSVLTQAFFDVKILFDVQPHVFVPPPKVQSTILRLIRKEGFNLGCSESLFFRVVKTAFNQRRKTLRNSLKGMHVDWDALPGQMAQQRPERLGFIEFAAITRQVKTDMV